MFVRASRPSHAIVTHVRSIDVGTFKSSNKGIIVKKLGDLVITPCCVVDTYIYNGISL